MAKDCAMMNPTPSVDEDSQGMSYREQYLDEHGCYPEDDEDHEEDDD